MVLVLVLVIIGVLLPHIITAIVASDLSGGRSLAGLMLAGTTIQIDLAPMQTLCKRTYGEVFDMNGR